MSTLRSLKRGVVRRRMKEEGINHKAFNNIWHNKKYMDRLLKGGRTNGRG